MAIVIKEAVLDVVCGVTSKFPETGAAEIAFAGRSNVGKSSLINGLLNRKKLARTSSQPGKTQTINYYHINKDFYFVDLPGYGYTGAAVAVRKEWGKMVERYLSFSKEIRAVFLLVDIRHEPTANDVQMYEWIRAEGYRPILIATKADKIKRSQLQKCLSVIRKTLHTDESTVIIPFSCVSMQGKEEIWKLIEDLLSEN